MLAVLAATGLCLTSCLAPRYDHDESGPDGAETRDIAQASSVAPGADPPGAPAPVLPAPPTRIEREGIAVEFSVVPFDPLRREAGDLHEGDDVRVQFRIVDTTTGSPVTTLEPAGWMHPATPDVDCKSKIRSFLEGTLTTRAAVDLNVYYVLSLNGDASISVVDPLFGYGGSKLLAMAMLKSPGEDWVLGPHGRHLFVTMPLVNQVAVVDTATWEVVTNVDAGQRPMRVSLQADGKYLWVGSDGVSSLDLTSGVTVIDVEKLEKVTQIPTGVGHHEIAFSDGDRHAFVANSDAGTVSVIDIGSLRKVRDIECGRSAVSVAYSSLSGAAYAVSRDEGTIAVIDGRSLEATATIVAEPGLGTLRFPPGGRFGFVVNGEEDVVHIIDASTNRIVQTADVGDEPDQVSFTETLAYVRSRGSETVLMIPLDQIGQEGAPVPVLDFTGGHASFGQGSLATADGIVAAPGGTSVLVANPRDKTIYYYREGMAAPMGEFHNYGQEPRAVLVVDRSLNEVEPGLYATDVRLALSGTLDVPFFLESPRIIHCFSLEVLADPKAPRDARPQINVESLTDEASLFTGEQAIVRFRVTDPRTDEPHDGLRDLGVLTVTPGNWQERQWARSVGEGVYEIDMTPPRPGPYFVSFQCPSLNVRLNELPPIVLRVVNKG